MMKRLQQLTLQANANNTSATTLVFRYGKHILSLFQIRKKGTQTISFHKQQTFTPFFYLIFFKKNS